MISLLMDSARYIQQLIFDPVDDPALRPRRRALPMSPEQREFRQRQREKWRKRIAWLIPDAKPPKKRKKVRRRKRKMAARRVPRPRKPRPDRVLKRQYKPLESPIYNMPAGLVDKLLQGKFNLRLAKHRAAAHKIADSIYQLYRDRDCMDSSDLRAMHDAIDKLADNPLPIADQLSDIRRTFEARKDEVQQGWSKHHEQKVNNYYLPPLEVERIAGGSEHLPRSLGREVIE